MRRRRHARDRVDEQIAAWRDATNETAPYILWSNAVETAAIRKGADGDTVRKNARIRSVLSRAYNHGEPVWMAADEVAFLAKEAKRPRVLSPGEELRQARALWFTHGPGKARDRRRRRR